MPNSPNTIRLEVPKARVAADLCGLIRYLSEAATQGALLQNWPNVITSLFGAAGTIETKQSEGALAWQLLLTGIGEALTEVANQQPPTLVNEQDVVTISERVQQEATALTIPVDFLDHPWNLSPVALAKNTLLKWLAPPADSPVPQDLVNLEHRFDAALVLGLHRAIRGDEAHYRPLLDLRKDPTGPAWRMLEDWRLYRAWLVSEFRTAPVFDESFAIDQIYVPLNAWHFVQQETDGETEPKKVRAVVNLNDDLLSWLRGERGRDRLRLVSGGPGSGKSSAMRALAATLAEKGNNGRPTDVLLFPLQRFQWRSGIVESVEATLNTYTDQMRHNPLDPNHLRERQEKPLLLIFDGLDELTASTQVGGAISATFLRELNTTLRSWQDRPIWVIVTGRDAIFGNVEGPTTALPGERFNLLPYHIRRDEPGAAVREDYDDPKDLLQTDNRKEAFRRFAKAKDQPSDDPPKMYGNPNLHDVSAQPLLNYFLLTSGPGKISDGNLARIYSHLFERLHARNRNVQNRPQDAGKPAAGLDQDTFDRAFEAMAVAAWRTGGTRAVRWDEVLTEVDREDSYLQPGESGLRDVFDTQMLDPGAQKPFRLAAAFFSRNEQATGVEFTHKSFGDYLYARRLAKAVASMADGLIRAPAVAKEMLDRWEQLTSDQRMSQEVRRFLELEIEATVSTKTRVKRHNVLAPVVEQVFREGRRFTSEPLPRRAEQRGSQMEEALFIAWHAMWRPDKNRRYWRLGENTGDLLYRALARQGSAHGLQYDSVFVRSWSGADLSGAHLSGAHLSGAHLSGAHLSGAHLADTDLGGADLSGAVLQNAYLGDADLEDTNLGDADLSGADLQNANLDNAYLASADLSDAHLGDAHLRNAYLGGADLSGADLSGADLSGANLRDAGLSGADLRDAGLSGADLRDAGLRDAVLQDTNLSGADLRGADLRDANLRRADLQDANLSGADLRGAVLQDTNLSGADLRGADLRDANLRGADLQDANLSGADLRGADLQDANLSGADLRGADLQDANLSRAELMGTKGLP